MIALDFFMASKNQSQSIESTRETVLSNSTFDQKQHVTVQWYLQQHGSFSSGGRSRDISLIQYSSTEHLIDYLSEYIKKNYQHIDITDIKHNVFDLCRIAIDESNKLLVSNIDEISRVTSRHIWPPNHKLLMRCLVDAHIVATGYDTNQQIIQHEEQENDDMTYCLITQLGNQPTHVKFVRGTNALREEILQRFKYPFKTTAQPSPKQNDLFLHKIQTLTIQEFCNYVTSQKWHDLNGEFLYGVLVDFIVAGEPLLFNE